MITAKTLKKTHFFFKFFNSQKLLIDLRSTDKATYKQILILSK